MKSTQDQDRIYSLLPAIYRERDASEGYPLRAMLRLVQEQADILQIDIQKLWDNYFIETCDQWVIPYIGDLVSNNLLHDASRTKGSDTAQTLFPDLKGRDLRPPIAIRTRADVAKTIYYRRRKGTLPMLEELARDVTGWPAHAVEFFQTLGWTENLNHLRLFNLDCPDLRRIEPLDRLNGPFDAISHTIDVRPICQHKGWYNIPNIGFFLWRLQSYPLKNVPARQAAEPWQYHFSPLGNPAPIFNAWRREGDETGLATELHVPGPIRTAFFFDDLERYRLQTTPRPDKTDLYGPLDAGGSLHIERNGSPVNPAVDPTADPYVFQPQIVCRRLRPWPAKQPVGQLIAVDVENGRLAVGDGWGDATTNIDVAYHYGFSAEMGGGPYERTKWLVDPSLADLQLYVQQDSTPAGYYSTLGAALAEWSARGKPNTIITILDNRTYAEPMAIELADEEWLVIEADNGVRPHLQPNGRVIRLTGIHPGSSLTLSGLLIEGAVEVEGEIETLRIIHTTLVPGRGLDEDGLRITTDPSVLVAESSGAETLNEDFELHAAFSILGPIQLPGHAEKIVLLDSIVDGIGQTAVSATGTTDQSAPTAVIERTTIFGSSFFLSIELSSEVIFTDKVTTELCQEGCVRFSFVPQRSEAPRRYHCQPDLEIARQIEESEKKARAAGTIYTPAEWKKIKDEIRNEISDWLVPSFTANNYGWPGYAQLRLGCPVQIRTGAEDGSEMGAFSHLKQAQRETNLRIRLGEYLPFGLETGLIYVT
jgi:hypothetical protein